MWCRPIGWRPSSSSPTKCRPRRCAAPAGRRRCSRWSGSLDRVARELSLDRAEVRRRNFIQPEQMPYAVGLLFRDGKPLVYDSGDYPKGQDEALRLAGYEGIPRAAARGARARPADRHRHRQLCRRHRARPVRGRHRARAAERQGRGRHRRHQSGPRAPAPRCRRSSPSRSAAASRTS